MAEQVARALFADIGPIDIVLYQLTHGIGVEGLTKIIHKQRAIIFADRQLWSGFVLVFVNPL